MLESGDILNYALTISVLVITFFVAWILYYFVKIFREIQRVIDDVTGAIEKFNSILDFTKDKISNAASVIPMVIKGGEKIFEMVNSMKDKKQSSTKKTSRRKTKTKDTDTDTLEDE